MIKPNGKPGGNLTVGATELRARVLRSQGRDSDSTSKSLILAKRPLAHLCYVLVALTFLNLLGALPSGENLLPFLNVTASVGLLLSCAWTCYRMMAANPLILWTPIPWMLGASMVYFGLGPLVYSFGNAYTIELLNDIYPVDAKGLWQTNLLNLFSLLIIITAFLVIDSLFNARMLGLQRTHFSRDVNDSKAKLAAFVFLGISLPVHFLVILPYEWSLTDYVLPGFINALDYLVPLGLMMLAYLAARRGGQWILLLLVLLVPEMILEFTRFSKTNLLLLALFVGLGVYQATKRTSVLLVMAGCVFTIYISVGSIVSTCREELLLRSQEDRPRVSLTERLKLAYEVSRGYLTEDLQERGSQTWWRRICYVNNQLFAIHLYESGRPGETFQMALYAFVPRILYPDKPIMTEVAVDFTEQLRGHRMSSTGIGIFGESYWNLGWFGVLIISVYVGCLFVPLSRLALAMLARDEWFFLPCALIAMKMGYRLDGWFVPDYVGGPLLYVAYFGILWIFVFRTNPRDDQGLHGPVRKGS